MVVVVVVVTVDVVDSASDDAVSGCSLPLPPRAVLRRILPADVGGVFGGGMVTPPGDWEGASMVADAPAAAAAAPPPDGGLLVGVVVMGVADRDRAPLPALALYLASAASRRCCLCRSCSSSMRWWGLPAAALAASMCSWSPRRMLAALALASRRASSVETGEGLPPLSFRVWRPRRPLPPLGDGGVALDALESLGFILISKTSQKTSTLLKTEKEKERKESVNKTHTTSPSDDCFGSPPGL